jgi:hypothetical protein
MLRFSALPFSLLICATLLPLEVKALDLYSQRALQYCLTPLPPPATMCYVQLAPAPLPFRIRLSNGFTRTDPSSFTAAEIADAGYTLVAEPAYNGATEKLLWVDGNYVIVSIDWQPSTRTSIVPNLYSYLWQRPAQLPHRIRMPDGFTRTDRTSFSADEILAAGYFGPYTEPSYDTAVEQLLWVDRNYVISPLYPPTTTSTSSVPGPLPILGLAAAFCFSRKLRQRIKLHKGTSDISTSAVK